MASRKEYEMLFALNAKMNGGFSGTFSKAQQEFSRLGKEIQELHKVQGDINSYQKQQQAVENTRSKLESLQKQHNLLQKEISETNGSTTGLERESVKLEQRIKDTETALERQNQKFKETEARLKEAGVDTSNLAQKDQELTAKIKELEAEQEKAANGADNFGDKAAQAFDAAGQALAAAGIAAAVKELTQAFVECVNIAGDFESAMSTVEALSGASAQEMAALSAQAKELGATTKFTAKESADAMGYMAMAGWDAAEMLQGMDGVLQLAAASGEDLAMVSDIVTDSLSAFGLTAADTAHFSDVLAAAATNSNTNVAIMGETFKMSASVAGALGYNIEDVAVAMGLMANSGVKGSIAGTALRNTFNGLLEGVTLTGAAFGEYEYCAVKADGTMKGFGATIDELRGYFQQMTEAERVNNAMAIAGQRGYNGLLAILNATDADYASLTESINSCTGAASRMAEIKLDNLNGQVTLMNSALDAVKTTIGEQFNPELRRLAEIATDALGVADTFIQENPALVKGVMTFTGVLGGAAVAITGVSAAVKVLGALNVASLFTNPVFLAAGAVAALAGGAMALKTAMDESIPPVKELARAARDMDAAMDEAGNTYEESMTQTLAAAEAADRYIDRLEELQAAEGGSAAENQEYQNTLALLLRTMPELSGCISQTTDEYGRSTYALETSTQALRQNTEEIRKNAQAQAYQEYLNSLYDEYGAVLLEAAENSVKLTQAEGKLKDLEEQREAALERSGQIYQDNIEKYGRVTQEWEDAQKVINGLDFAINDTRQEIANLNAAIDEDTAATGEAEAAFESAKEIIEQLTGAVGDQTGADEELARQSAQLADAIGGVSEQAAALAEAYNEAYTAALESVSGQYALWDEAAQVAAVSAGSINSALESQAKYWQDYNANLQALGERAGDIEGLRDVIASFADGSQESVNAVAGMAGATDEELAAMVANWNEVQREQEAAAQSLAEMETGMTAVMDQWGQALAEDIAGMDLSEEAKAAGEATIQGYINAAHEMLPQVRTAYRGLLDGAIGSLWGAPASGGSSGRAYLDDGRAHFNDGYATGTENAQPGWAWVGENGPELMFFNGGEKVLNAAQSAAVQAEPVVSAIPTGEGGSAATPVSVTFQIAGDATEKTVQDLRGFADELVGRVMDAIDERAEDEKRCAMR